MPLSDSNKTDQFDRTEVSLSEASSDAFGRLRTSMPESLFDVTFQYNKMPQSFSELTANGGTIVHNSDIVSVELNCATTLNSRSVFQSRRYFKYHAGKSQIVVCSGNLKGAATNVIKRVGQYDDNNGYFFELSSSTLSVNLRSRVSGSIVDTKVNQSSWNIDKLDGTGPSGITLDVSKQILFFIDYQWLGSGRVRYGFVIGGRLIYCHEMNHSNILTVPYSQTACLPIRVEIVNTGSTASSMHFTCVSVFSEGGWAPNGKLNTAFNQAGVNFSGALSTLPLVAIRKNSQSLAVPVELIDFGMYSVSGDDFILVVYKNPTITGGTWTSNGSYTEYNRTATAISGGEILYSHHYRGATSTQAVASDILKSVESGTLGSDLNGNSEVICIAAINITSNASAFGFVNYKEYP